MRLDKYLKVSRLIKRRTVANDACDSQHISVNGKIAKASYEVKEGDIIEITFGEKTLRIFLSLTCMSCFIKMNSIFFQAAGKPIFAAISSTIRDVVCFVPLILILPLIFTNVESILYAAPISDLVAMVVTLFLTVRFLGSLTPQNLEKQE